MTKKIYKYDVSLEDPTFLQIKSDLILDAIYQRGKVVIYALVDEGQEAKAYEVRVCATGEEMDDTIQRFAFLKTIAITDNLIIHVFYNKLSGENREMSTIVSLPLEFYNKKGQLEFVQLKRDIETPSAGWENKEYVEVEEEYFRIVDHKINLSLCKEIIDLTKQKTTCEQALQMRQSLEDRGWDVTINHVHDYTSVFGQLEQEIAEYIYSNRELPRLKNLSQEDFNEARQRIVVCYEKACELQGNASRRYLEFVELLNREIQDFSNRRRRSFIHRDENEERYLLELNALELFKHAITKNHPPEKIVLLV